MKTIKNLTADELRKSILQLAIQGKLVKQNPDDEPASELVKKIYEEKKKLVAEGKIKKDKNESYIFKGDDNCYYEKIGKEIKCIDDELPFEIPDNWTWIRVSSICKTIGGYAFKSSQFTNTGIRVIRISDFDETGIKNKDIKRYKFTDKLKDYQIMLNDILMCMTGGTVGKAVLITQIDEPMYINQRVALFRSDFINNEYLYCVLVSLHVREIIKSSKTSTNDNISMDLLNNILLPLPPENEQSRIIRAISNYEPLLNKYADLEFKLSKLESSFEEKLKASILQYAIEGKLVKQDPADEPASVLLERIKAEKEKLIKEGKIKRDKKESFIYQSDDKNYYDNQDNLIDVPLEIPDNWLWCYLPTIASFSLGKTPERNNDKYWNNGAIPWVSISDLYDKKTINSSKEKVSVSAIIDVFKNIIVSKGTLLMSFKLTIGKTSILGMDAVHNEAIISIVPYYDKNYFIRDYLLNFLSILCQFIEQTSAIKGNTLNKEKLKRMLIPLPPECQIYKINDTLKRLFSFIES